MMRGAGKSPTPVFNTIIEGRPPKPRKLRLRAGPLPHLTRILDHSGETVPSLFNSEELRRDYDGLRARLERCFASILERANRDGLPDTED